MTARRSLRRVTGVSRHGDEVRVNVAALRCVPRGVLPGYLTGEPLAEQGVETALPNLSNLKLPPLDARDHAVRIGFAAPEILRLTISPVGARALEDDGTWAGIVTDPRPEAAPITVSEAEETITVATSRLRVVVQRRPFAVWVEDVSAGTVVLQTAHRMRQVAGLPVAPPVVTGEEGATLHLELGVDEDILGFGEQFGRVVKNGQELVLRAEDAQGTGTGKAYKPIPVWNSTAGYTGLLNTGAVVTADVGHHRPSVFGLTVDDEEIDLYLIAGESPKERLTSLGKITGTADVPPVWAFGFWVGRCRYHSREQMEEVGQRMRELAVPCDVLHLDPDWLVLDRLNCDFVWNTDRFGDRRAFVEALEALGFRLSVWELPYLDPASPRYAEAETNGFLVRDSEGNTASIARTPTPDRRPRALLDFTNPDARAWWQGLHEDFLADGVAVFKTDFGEALPDDVQLADGTPANHAHNLYPLRYNAAVSEVIARHTGRNPLVWGRSGWAGSHRYPAQWGGDAESSIPGMQATLRGGLSMGLSAPGLWSHDVGGFFGPELTPELYVRWAQFGALSPLMRAHGLRPREPWAFGDAALEIARQWIRLRYSLVPYLWQVAHEAAANTWPVLRPLAFEFPHDPTARTRDDTFLLGSDLLVVPVFDDRAAPVVRRFYVPEGRWTDLLTGASYAGPGFAEDKVPLERIPLLARDGALIPRVTIDESVRHTDDLLDLPWVLYVVGSGDVEGELVSFDGTRTHFTVRGATVEAEGTQPVTSEPVRVGR